jgi:signal peptidase I
MDKYLKFLWWTGGTVIVLALLGRLLLFDVYTLPDGGWLATSVAPTLGGGDTVLVLGRGEPTFGDLVRCPDPEKEGFVIGRIVGTAGDQVEIKGRSLRVNGRRYDALEACVEPRFSVAHPDTGSATELRCSRAGLGGGWHFLGTSERYSPSNDASHRVGDGRIYLLSDNRDLHDDSRDFGAVPLAGCEGPIFFRLWGPGGFTDSDRRFDVIR